VNWEKEHANAILESWYSGEEGGTAIAETLSGKNNPAGRLPVTFYKDIHQLPHFEDYSMKGRTYRYFEGEPLWPFGFGLSYTTFTYSNLALPDAPVNAGDPLHTSVTVANTGKVAGDEVVELYLQFPDVSGAPRRGAHSADFNASTWSPERARRSSSSWTLAISAWSPIWGTSSWRKASTRSLSGAVSPEQEYLR
jgi:hypothetical protein